MRGFSSYGDVLGAGTRGIAGARAAFVTFFAHDDAVALAVCMDTDS